MAGEQPKKPAGGAFGRYLNEQRPALMKECSGKPITAVTKLGSERFKALDAGSKAKYEAMYQTAKKKYDEDMKKFLAAGGEVKKKEKKAKGGKKVKDANRPKKPAGGAYGCFLNKNRAAFMKECTGKPITAVSKLASERWKLLSASEKKPFEEEYEAKAKEYKKAMASYVPPAPSKDDKEEEEDDDEDEDEEDEDDEDEDDDEEEDEPPAKKRPAAAPASPKKAPTKKAESPKKAPPASPKKRAAAGTAGPVAKKPAKK